MNLLLDITKENYSTFRLKDIADLGETLAFGGKMLLIGILTVFAVLAMIWGALVLFKIFFHDLPAKKAAEKAAAASVPATEYVADNEGFPEELVAVFAAAIAAAESDAGGKKFRVVSFRRN